MNNQNCLNFCHINENPINSILLIFHVPFVLFCEYCVWFYSGVVLFCNLQVEK